MVTLQLTTIILQMDELFHSRWWWWNIDGIIKPALHLEIASSTAVRKTAVSSESNRNVIIMVHKLMSMNKGGWFPFCVPLCATWDHKGHRWSSDFLSIWEKVDVIWNETEAVKKSEKENLKRSARSKAKDRCVSKKGLVDWEQSKDVHWQQGTKKRLMWLAGWKILNSNNTKPDPLPLPSSNPLHLECDLPQQLNTMKKYWVTKVLIT